MKASKTLNLRTYVIALVASGIWLAAAQAVVLPPGGAVVLSGRPGTPGVVIYDNVIDFEIRGVTGGLLFKGRLQDRVVRNAGGTLEFDRRIRDTQAGLNGYILSVETEDFAGYSTDVDYSTSGLGTVGPNGASRSFDGSLVAFDFSGNPLYSGLESRFIENVTDAMEYGPGGSTTIRLQTGHMVVIPTVQPVRDRTPPIAVITSPGPFSCVCNPTDIIGTADDPDGTLTGWRLEYASNPAGPWTLIASGTTPVVNGLLAAWNTGALPQGYYFLRLTAENSVGLTATFVTVVFVDKQFDSLVIRWPSPGAIVGGVVCFDGTITDYCFKEYAIGWVPAGGPFVFAPIDPANPVYTTPVINDPLGQWNTVAAGVPDGTYVIRTIASDVCGNSARDEREIIVDNTPPKAEITSPKNCQCVNGLVRITGTAWDQHLAGWVLQYTGGDANGWVTIASGNSPIVDGLLGVWDTRELRPCCYTIRLVVTDAATVNCDGPHRSEYLVSVDVGDCRTYDFDTDDDGDVDVNDFAVFQVCFNGSSRPPACP